MTKILSRRDPNVVVYESATAETVRAAVIEAVARGAYLGGAYLRGAYLRGAYLRGAYLRGAYLRGAYLGGAYLRGVRDDLYEVLAHARNEAPGLLAALRAGRVEGAVYEGECACLIGTIANVRGVKYTELPDLRPNGSRPAERWFLAISRGHTPDTSPVVAITAEWIEAWIAEHPPEAS